MKRTIAALVVLVACATAPAADMVPTPGSSVKFPAGYSLPAGEGKTLELRVTGTALRTKTVLGLSVNVYAVASYVDAAAKPTSAEELVKLDACKQLHLVMERDLAGKQLADAFREQIAKEAAPGAYADEMKQLCGVLESTNVKKGDRVVLTHMPGMGLHVAPAGKDAILINNVDFSRAVWGIYFGRSPVTDAVKKGLLSGL